MSVKTSFLQKIIISTLLLLVNLTINAQNELMIQGIVQTTDNSVQGTRLKVEIKDEYKTIIDERLDATGQYRLDLPYGNNYTITFSKPGYTPMVFEANLDMPEGVKECCYRPLNISFHLFKPDGVHDKLFNKTFHVIQYEKALKGLNYDLDIDYMVQQRIVNDEIFNQKKLEAKEGNQARKDSVLTEKKYLALINQGTEFYNNKQFYAARKMFVEAQNLRPERMYTYYKLEDIRTELEVFETKAELLGVNVDSLIAEELSITNETEETFTYPPFVPLTQAQIDEIFRNDVQKQVIASSANVEEANRTLAIMNDLFDEEFKPIKKAQFEKETQAIAYEKTKPKEDETQTNTRVVDLSKPITTPVALNTPKQTENPVPVNYEAPKNQEEAKDLITLAPEDTKQIEEAKAVEQPKVETKPTVETKPVVETKPTVETKPVAETKPTVESKPIAETKPVNQPTTKPVTTQAKPVTKVVDYKSYQDSLNQKYSLERTIEVTQDAYKKTTRVFMNNGQIVEVYAMVEHSWGATYYYLEEYPSGYQNIGYSAFMGKTKLYEITEQKK